MRVTDVPLLLFPGARRWLGRDIARAAAGKDPSSGFVLSLRFPPSYNKVWYVHPTHHTVRVRLAGREVGSFDLYDARAVWLDVRRWPVQLELLGPERKQLAKLDVDTPVDAIRVVSFWPKLTGLMVPRRHRIGSIEQTELSCR